MTIIDVRKTKDRGEVFVDGKKILNVFYADTDRGFVRYFLEPLRVNPRGTGARWAKLRGKVKFYVFKKGVDRYLLS